MTPRISLDQWRAFIAVVEKGGYAQAAEALHLSQSTVSYALARLHALLGVRVLEVEGRKARLTPAGEALLPRARHLVADALRLEQAARALGQGWEAQVRLVIDVLCPPGLILAALEAFRRRLPTEGGTQVVLREEVMSGTEAAILDGRTNLGVHARVPEGCSGEPLFEVEFIPVSHPDHELQALGRVLEPADLERAAQVFIRDTGTGRVEHDVPSSPLRWTVGSRETALHMVRHGFGFCWTPREWVAADLQAGRLAPLPMQHGDRRRVPIYLVHPPGTSAGPATALLAACLREAVQTGLHPEP